MNSYKTYIPKFFIFYDEFNFENNVVSTYDGRSIERSFYDYKDEIEEYPLCVFGPINKSKNVAKKLSSKDIKYFIALFRSLAHELNKKYDFNN